MVRPLKKCTRQGTPYVRPAVIEQSIALALTQDLDQLRTRAAVADRTDPAYLESEVLVHLIRNALTASDKKTAHALMDCLGRRCARILKRKVPATRLFNANDVQEETLGALYELFAKDLYAPNVGVLDFFEIKFKKKVRVNYLSTEKVGVDVPCLHLRGWWLHHAGFTIGRNLKIEVSEGKLLIEAC